PLRRGRGSSLQRRRLPLRSAPVGLRGERHERVRAPFLRGGALAAAFVLASACGPGDGGLPGRRQAAARPRGAWLLARGGSMPPDWASSVFSNRIPIAPDAALADACREALDAASRAPFQPLPANLQDPALLELATLRGVVAELLRRQRVGEPWQGEARALGSLVRAHAEEIQRDTSPTQQAVLLYGFESLGIDPGGGRGAAVRLLRQRWRWNDRERIPGHAPFVSGLPHVLYTASGYFQRSPDARAFARGGVVLRGALRHSLAGPP